MPAKSKASKLHSVPSSMLCIVWRTSALHPLHDHCVEILLRDSSAVDVVQPSASLLQCTLEKRIAPAGGISRELPYLLHQRNRHLELVKEREEVLQRRAGVPMNVEGAIREPWCDRL